MTKDPKEYAVFAEMIRDHFAQLAAVSQEFTRRLVGGERDQFLEQTLEVAWDRRKLFKPEQQALIGWWADCCQVVALSRREWTVWYINGPRQVKGKHLRSA